MARANPSIPYLKNYLVKPSRISALGVVKFTDGTNEVTPNQKQCEAYGYRYDVGSGTCHAYTNTPNLGLSLNKVNNTIQGSNNITEQGTNNTYIMGENNTVKGASRNNIIVGSNNEIANGINNANVFGTLGEATASNSIVLGGNKGTDNLGERQSIQLLYGVTSTDGSTIASYLNNTTDSYLTVPTNAIMYFHADCVAVRVGGTAAGNVGDYKSWVERGVVINESGTLSIQRERDVIKSVGTTTGWQPTGGVSGTDFYIYVKGTNDMTLEWACNVTFTQIKTGVAL